MVGERPELVLSFVYNKMLERYVFKCFVTYIIWHMSFDIKYGRWQIRFNDVQECNDCYKYDLMGTAGRKIWSQFVCVKTHWNMWQDSSWSQS